MEEYNEDQVKMLNKVKEKDIATAKKIRDAKLFFWNGETREFLGRNALSWLKITIFYIFFFFGLGLFFWICMVIFQQTLFEDRPKWILSEGIIETPGLSMRPQSDVIEFRTSTSGHWESIKIAQGYAQAIEDHIQKIHKTDSEELLDCDYTNGLHATENETCRVQINQFSECNKENGYGYNSPSTGPCILLKLNKVYGWKPKGYGVEQGKFNMDALERDLSRLPKEANDMAEYIKESLKNETYKDHAVDFLNSVWVTCKERKDKSVSFKYLPQPGFPGYYYPYYNQQYNQTKGYQSPYILVKIEMENTTMVEDLKSECHYLEIECYAWAKNIEHDIRNDRIMKTGMETFKICTRTKQTKL